jgi:hypothetical protein
MDGLTRLNLNMHEPAATNAGAKIESPGKDKETNWLPAPKGPFVMFAPLLAERGSVERQVDRAAAEAGGVNDSKMG